MPTDGPPPHRRREAAPALGHTKGLAWAGLAGVACTTASAPILPIWGFPGTSASAAAISAFLSRHHAGLIAGGSLDVLGVTLWLAVAAAVRARLVAAAGHSDGIVALFTAGFTAFTGLILTGFLVMFVFIGQLPGPHYAKLLYHLTFGFLAISGAPTALCLAAYAVEVSRTRCLPYITVVLAMVVAVAHLGLVFSVFGTSGFFSLEGQVITVVPGLLFVWLAWVATVLIRTSEPAC